MKGSSCFDGPEWKGWKKRTNHNAVERKLGPQKWAETGWISVIGQLNIMSQDGGSICFDFGKPEIALKVANAIIAAHTEENKRHDC